MGGVCVCVSGCVSGCGGRGVCFFYIYSLDTLKMDVFDFQKTALSDLKLWVYGWFGQNPGGWGDLENCLKAWNEAEIFFLKKGHNGYRKSEFYADFKKLNLS